MPVVNPLVRELVFKIVYYGPGLGGKTTSLHHIHTTARPEHRGKMVSLATPVDRTLYFDFLPVRMPSLRGMNVRLQLFTVPGQVYYNATRRLVLTGADAVVLVFDSQRGRRDANLESLDNLIDNLTAHGKPLAGFPHVIQYNKRDLEDAMPIEELERELNRHGAPSFGTSALHGEGVYEALDAIVRILIEDFQRRTPESQGTESYQLEMPEGGLVDALRAAEESSEPPAASVRRTEASGAEPSATGLPRLSQLPDADPGEAAARAAAGDIEALREPTLAPSSAPLPPPSEPFRRAESAPPAVRRFDVTGPGLSFAVLWPPAERATVEELERALASGDTLRSVECAERLVSRALAGVGAQLGGGPEAPRDPALVALLLGLDGRRYLELRSLVRDARAGRGISLPAALAAYATAVEVRLLRARLGS